MRYLGLILLLSLTLLGGACARRQTARSVLIPAVPTPTSTLAPRPTFTPTPRPTLLPLPETVQVTTNTLDVRQGPGLDYPVVIQVARGAILTVRTRDATGNWLQVAHIASEAWVHASLTAPYHPDPTAAVPPVIFLNDYALYHLFGNCASHRRQALSPEEYPYHPTIFDDYGKDRWDVDPGGFGSDQHPFVDSMMAEGYRIAPIWARYAVDGPRLQGAVRSLHCASGPDFPVTSLPDSAEGPVSVRWLGQITVPASDPIVHLTVRSGVGLRLFLGGELVVDAITQTSPWHWTGQRGLTPGVHVLRLEYVERTGPVPVTLHWAYSSGEQVRQGETTTATVLRTAPAATAAVVAHLAAGTPVWLESWKPATPSQYWLGATGAPGWWQTRWAGEPVWLEAAGVTVTRVQSPAAFLDEWEATLKPAPTAPTDLCTRSGPARFLILQTLTGGWQELLSCAAVTPVQLASLTHLRGVLDYGTEVPRAQDLAGLTHLGQVQVRVGAAPLPAGFLPPGAYGHVRLLTTRRQALVEPGWAHGARLDRLELQGRSLETVPAGLLAGLQVRVLHLALSQEVTLPAHLSLGMAELRELRLQSWDPVAPDPYKGWYDGYLLNSVLARSHRGLPRRLPTILLQGAPHLETLHLDMPQMVLPTALLTDLPRLRTLRLRSDLQQVLALERLDLAGLEVLELVDPIIVNTWYHPAETFPRDFLWDLPRLRRLHIHTPRVRSLPADWLAQSAHLEVLELTGMNWDRVSALSLEGTPHLRQLRLKRPALLTFPGDIRNPHTVQRYEPDATPPYPADWLQKVPHLELLAIDVRSGSWIEFAPEDDFADWPEIASMLEYLPDYVTVVRETVRQPFVRAQSWSSAWQDLQPPADWRLQVRYTEGVPVETAPYRFQRWVAPRSRRDPAHPPGRPVTLGLEGDTSIGLPESFLAQASHLTLQAPSLVALPESFLAQAPHLTHLTLQAPSLVALPDTLLARVPLLAHLTLEVPRLLALPDGVLAQASQLTHLSLEVPSLPDSFLLQAPQLTHLALRTPHLTGLPDTFLAQAPRLTHFTLEAPRLTGLPDAFLAQAPRLEVLRLIAAHQLMALPPHFLTVAPHLIELHLTDAYRLTALPAEFLRHTPQLTELVLEARLTALPAEFLASAPWLATLVLRVEGPAPLPPAFLAHTPRRFCTVAEDCVYLTLDYSDSGFFYRDASGAFRRSEGAAG